MIRRQLCAAACCTLGAFAARIGDEEQQLPGVGTLDIDHLPAVGSALDALLAYDDAPAKTEAAKAEEDLSVDQLLKDAMGMPEMRDATKEVESAGPADAAIGLLDPQQRIDKVVLAAEKEEERAPDTAVETPSMPGYTAAEETQILRSNEKTAAATPPKEEQEEAAQPLIGVPLSGQPPQENKKENVAEALLKSAKTTNKTPEKDEKKEDAPEATETPAKSSQEAAGKGEQKEDAEAAGEAAKKDAKTEEASTHKDATESADKALNILEGAERDAKTEAAPTDNDEKEGSASESFDKAIKIVEGAAATDKGETERAATEPKGEVAKIVESATQQNEKPEDKLKVPAAKKDKEQEAEDEENKDKDKFEETSVDKSKAEVKVVSKEEVKSEETLEARDDSKDTATPLVGTPLEGTPLKYEDTAEADDGATDEVSTPLKGTPLKNSEEKTLEAAEGMPRKQGAQVLVEEKMNGADSTQAAVDAFIYDLVEAKPFGDDDSKTEKDMKYQKILAGGAVKTNAEKKKEKLQNQATAEKAAKYKAFKAKTASKTASKSGGAKKESAAKKEGVTKLKTANKAKAKEASTPKTGVKSYVYEEAKQPKAARKEAAAAKA